MSWAALPWATSKELKPRPAFRFFSLCLKTKGNQGQKEESRRLPEKKSYCISRNIFCINWKEEKKSLLENTCDLHWSHSAPHLQGWATSRRKIPLPHSPISLSAPLAFFPIPWSFPAWQFTISFIPGSPHREPSQSFHNYRMIYLEKQLLLNNFSPFAFAVQPSFTWGCFWQPGIPVAFIGPSLLEELLKKWNSILISSMPTLIWSKIKLWFPHLCKSKTFLSGVAEVWLIKEMGCFRFPFSPTIHPQDISKTQTEIDCQGRRLFFFVVCFFFSFPFGQPLLFISLSTIFNLYQICLYHPSLILICLKFPMV